MKLNRFSCEPILAPNSAHPWEALVTTNPAAWHDPSRGKVFLLYRAAGNDEQYRVTLGLAESTDGFHFTPARTKPVMEPLEGFIDGGGIEDPRLVKFGDWYYLTYACRPFPNGQYWVPDRSFRFNPVPELPQPLRDNGMSTAMAFSKDLISWIRAGLITTPGEEDHDVVLFPEKIGNRFFFMHRPIIAGETPCIYLADTDNPLVIRNSRKLLQPEQDWEARKIGANAPPLRTPRGWLCFYHGVGTDDFYRLGAFLLDLENPDRLIARTREPIFQPEAPFELKGCHNYRGVVFPCGNIILDGEIIVYYGAADKYVGIAHAPLLPFLEDLLNEPTQGNATP